MKLEQQLLINREWSYNGNYWSTGNEVNREQGMKLETTTGNEVRTTTTDQQGMKLEQQLLVNREWS